MIKIAILNKISQKGLSCFSSNFTQVDDVNEANGILVRSQDLRSMEFSTHLLAIARAGAGVNNIPLDRCSESGIVVFNTPGANANAVKELVLTGLLMAARNLTSAIAWTKTLTDDIPKAVEKNKSKFAGHEIKGKTIGVIGLGSVGVMVANGAECLGMRVLGYDPYISVVSAHDLSSNVHLVETLDALLPLCDYVTIHVPFMENTKEMINRERLAMMKKNVCLLNFSRDQLVHENDVLEAIENDIIRSYITDFPSHRLLENEKVICIPHLGASTHESEENCSMMAVEEIIDFLENGNIRNSVNFPAINLGVCTSSARLVVLNKNVPAMLGSITGCLAEMNINISNLINRSKGDYAVTLVDIDSYVDEAEIKSVLESVDGIISVRVLPNDRDSH
ncbi:MAG: 3-phosphoglycerate dehydrogenase [Firmicutes bacterium HGW-Firmicutes-11]|jgi:D-3-phosphoglycerate dehydrogenase|nr:MAG: 3-phosphoglycerate dehydrogenase [Firmicutes bacterium HGW-Firmicutes-11]